MTNLNPADLDSFTRRYRWTGRVARVRFTNRRGQLNADVVLRVRTAIQDLGAGAAAVKLHVRFEDVDECRFQKRPGQSRGELKNAKFGFIDGLFYVTFDDWSLEPGERPKVHDFRSSDAYLAAKDLRWEELPGRPA